MSFTSLFCDCKYFFTCLVYKVMNTYLIVLLAAHNYAGVIGEFNVTIYNSQSTLRSIVTPSSAPSAEAIKQG